MKIVKKIIIILSIFIAIMFVQYSKAQATENNMIFKNYYEIPEKTIVKGAEDICCGPDCTVDVLAEFMMIIEFIIVIASIFKILSTLKFEKEDFILKISFLAILIFIYIMNIKICKYICKYYRYDSERISIFIISELFVILLLILFKNNTKYRMLILFLYVVFQLYVLYAIMYIIGGSSTPFWDKESKSIRSEINFTNEAKRWGIFISLLEILPLILFRRNNKIKSSK